MSVSHEQGIAVFDYPALGRLVERWIQIPIATAMTGSEQDTGIDLPAKCLVKAVVVDVTTAEVTGTTKTIDVGLLASESGGDADGFVDGLSVASTGLKQPTLDSAAQTVGVLMHVDESGTSGLVPEPHCSSVVTARSISVTSGSAFTEFRGSVYILISEVAAL